jgi:hypothetical protein
MSLARRFNAGISVNDVQLVAAATTEHQPSLRDGLWNASRFPALKGRAKVISSLRDVTAEIDLSRQRSPRGCRLVHFDVLHRYPVGFLN